MELSCSEQEDSLTLCKMELSGSEQRHSHTATRGLSHTTKRETHTSNWNYHAPQQKDSPTLQSLNNSQTLSHSNSLTIKLSYTATERCFIFGNNTTLTERLLQCNMNTLSYSATRRLSHTLQQEEYLTLYNRKTISHSTTGRLSHTLQQEEYLTLYNRKTISHSTTGRLSHTLQLGSKKQV